MRQSVNKIFVVLLGIVVLALTAVLTAPWEERVPSFSVKSKLSQTDTLMRQMDINENQYQSSETVASIFGWKKEKQSAINKKNIPVQLEKANWIKPLGFVRGSDDRKFYFLKDIRENNILVIEEGCIYNGWKLIEIENDHFVLEYEGKKYIVMKN
jgi:hypothetical protein